MVDPSALAGWTLEGGKGSAVNGRLGRNDSMRELAKGLEGTSEPERGLIDLGRKGSAYAWRFQRYARVMSKERVSKDEQTAQQERANMDWFEVRGRCQGMQPN